MCVHVAFICQFTVSGIKVQGLRVYPNPVGEEFTVDGLIRSMKASLVVYNVFGEKVYSKELTGNSKQETVNCKDFAAGIYFLKVVSPNGSWVGRFVKE